MDSILLALDVGYRGSLAVFFFRKFFDFAVPQVFEHTNSKSNSQVKYESMENENVGISKTLERPSDIVVKNGGIEEAGIVLKETTILLKN